MHGLHFYNGLWPADVAVISGKLPKRTFHLGIAGMQQTLDDQFSTRGDWKTHMLGLGQLDGPAHDAASNLEFRFFCAEDVRAYHEQDRVDAVGCDDFARLA